MKGVSIAPVSIGLAIYEAVAIALLIPTISELSHRWPWALLVWGWLLWLALHFVLEARRPHVVRKSRLTPELLRSLGWL